MKTIYYNGKVYTGMLPLASAFVEEDGKILCTGSDNECLSCADSETEKIDLSGKFVTSSFNDSHMHVLSYGHALTMAKLDEHTDSLEGMLSYLKEFAEQNTPENGMWLLGRGWNQDYFSDVNREPNRYDLDRISTEYPIACSRCCGHSMAVNSKVIELLNITKDTPQVEGGIIGIENGEPNGLFYDNAIDLISAHIPVPSKEEIKKMLQLAFHKLNEYGITSAQTDDYGVFPSISWKTINECYQELEKEGKLTVRIYEQSLFSSVKSLSEFIEAGNNTGTGSDMFKIGPLKMIGDGSLGARTAFLSAPYSDASDTTGIAVFDQTTMTDMIDYANSKGMQVAIHSIGDESLEYILNSVDTALKNNYRKDHRHGIVHCQISRADQLDRIAKLNMHVYAQPIFIDYDSQIVESRVGKERALTSYSWKTLMKKGVTVSSGTDCPVELPFALGCIQCAVTRSPLSGNRKPYLTDEAFTVKEALDSYTKVAAYASFEENIKGQLKKGYYADFTILDKNIFEVPVDEIKNIKVISTYLEGKKVY